MFQLLAKTNTKFDIFYSSSFPKKMNECLKNVSHTEGEQFLLLGALNGQF